MNITTLSRKNVQELTPYQSARRLGGNGDIWLNANEYAISPDFQLSKTGFNRYPDPQPQEVIEGYANYLGVSAENVLVSRGGDESIELLIRAFCEQDEKVLICPPTYGMYEVSARTNGIDVVYVPTLADFQLDLKNIEQSLAQDSKIKVIFVCNPNNPTGTLLNRADLLELLEFTRNRAIVVVDEAYMDFSSENTITNELAKFPHLAVIRTLSKAFALAGLRCGFTIANPELIGILQKVIAPYPLPTVVADIASQALQANNVAEVKQRIEQLNLAREQLAKELIELDFVKRVEPSFGNFLLFECEDGMKVFNALWEQGIILRNQHTAHNLANCIRISIGTDEENSKVINALKAIK